MPRIWRALVSVAVGAVVPGVIAAQTIRGAVRDSVATAPISGAVVAIIDSAGATVARGIANGTGQFTLARPARAVRLRVIRIGYQPRELELPRSDRALDIVMVRIPLVLDAVRVSDRELCPGGPERGAAFELWEQARAGLLAAVVANETNPATATTVLFHRRLAPGDNIVQSQHVDIRSGRTTRPFSAFAPARTFAERGYIAEDETGRTYYAPDAEVLLDESFATTHCFRLRAADDAHPDQVGIAFAPASGRDTLVDVTGVIWIDRTTPALRSMSFRYIGLEPAATRADAGGELAFRTMPNGASFVERWNLRLPIMARLPPGAATLEPPAPGANRRERRGDFRVTELQEAGGQVADAKWRDSTVWREPPTALGGLVSQEGTNAAIAGAIITLAGTADTARSDAFGQFTLAPIVPGRYAVIVVDTSFGARSGTRRVSQTIDIGRGVVTDFRPRLPSPKAVVASTSRTRVIRGVVTDTADRPVRDVNVVVRDAAAAVTDDSGRFRLQLQSHAGVVLDIRRIGFMPSRFGFSDGGDTSIVITLLPSVQQLATVEVTASATSVSPNLRGFEQRMHERVRGTNSGFFVTAEEIERRRPVFATQLFEAIPSIRVLQVGTRGNRSVFGIGHTLRDGPVCPAAVYIDGVKIPDGGDEVFRPPGDTTNQGRGRIDPKTGMPPREPGVPIDQLVTPWDVAGIEVYRSANDAPPQFQALNGGCAVVAIWTKHGG